jgi:hypothetical protein
MKTRLIIPAIAALLAAACTTDGYRSDLIITSVVLPTATTTVVGTATQTTCTLNTSAAETILPNFLPATPGNFAFVGFVVNNQLTNTASLNTTLRTNTTLWAPDVAVVDYQIIGGGTIAEQRIATSGGSVNSGQINTVGVPLFSPAAVIAALPANGQVRTTTHIEGHLDDGTTVSTTDHDYIIQICNGGTNCTAISCF